MLYSPLERGNQIQFTDTISHNFLFLPNNIPILKKGAYTLKRFKSQKLKVAFSNFHFALFNFLLINNALLYVDLDYGIQHSLGTFKGNLSSASRKIKRKMELQIFVYIENGKL